MTTGTRGSRLTPLPRPGTPDPGPWARLARAFAKVPPRLRVVGGTVAALVLAGWLAWAGVSAAHRPEALFPVPVPSAELVEMAGELTRQGIPFEVAASRDGLLVAPGRRAEALQALEARGLPRTLEEAPTASGAFPLTSDERQAAQHAALEAELSRSLRRLDGLADAAVKIARPHDTPLMGDPGTVTATVTVSLQPGVSLSREQVNGVAQLVAFSVPDLKVENVRVLDRSMRVLNPWAGHEEDAAATLPVRPDELQAQMEAYLTSRLQRQLDRVMGPGRALASVHADLDFSQVETTRKTFGGPQDHGRVLLADQSEEESLQRGEDGERSYAKARTAAKYAVNEAVVRTVERLPRVKRLSCSVALDNPGPEASAAIERLAAGALGIDSARGDTLAVVSLPFAPEAPLVAAAPAPLAAPAVPLPYAPLAGAMALATVAAALALRLRRSTPPSPAPLARDVPAGTIVDLLQTKAEGPGETRVQQAGRLERIEPRKMAELLKSTWLTDSKG